METNENQKLPFTISTPLSQETDKLLRRYLKIQIASHIWNLVFKVIMLIFFIISFVVGTTTLLPFLEGQLNSLSSVYQMSQPQDDSPPVNDIINRFNNQN